MAEMESIQRTEVAAPQVDYAFWDVPGAEFKIIYSLPLFHEIDFAVNEGYRKIPHGGIEVGGVLFGRMDSESVRLESFRPIHCEHASGPSLQLSEKDLARLAQQLSDAASDAELRSLQPVGWFLAHTRSPLELTETEAKQFERFFPGPHKVTVLVKPERFQPTRFGFLVRGLNGEMPREATPNAVILPLPGRAKKAGQFVPSIPAPASPVGAGRRMVIPAAPEAESASGDGVLPDREEEAGLNIETVPAETQDSDAVGALEDLRSPDEKARARRMARERARVMEEAFPPGAAVPPPAPTPPSAVTPPSPVSPPIAETGTPWSGGGYMPASDPQRSYALDEYSRVAPRGSLLTGKSSVVLALAALLGCLAGYIAYLQLPAQVIPLDVQTVNHTIIVSWPANETKNAVYATIRLNDGAPVPLSAEERLSGQISLAAEKDFKVELTARNWIRDCRGIVRYVKPANH